MKTPAIAIVLCLVAAASAHAATAGRNLVIHFHRSPGIGWQDQERFFLDEDNTFAIRHGSRVAITVADPNPLLYTYSAGAITSKKTADYEVAGKLGGALAELAGILKGAAPVVGSPPGKGRPPSPQTFVELESIEGLRLATFNEAIKAAREHMNQIGALLEQSGLDPQGAKSAVAAWDLEKSLKTIEDGLDELHAAADLCLTGQDIRVNGASQPCRAHPEVQAWIALALAREVDARSAIALLRSFSADAGKLLEPVVLVEKIAYSPNEVQSVAVQFEPRGRYTGQMSSTFAAGLMKRSVAVHIEPHSPVHLELGPALVYSFVEVPEFGVADRNGALEIVRTGDDVSAVDVGAMLNLIPKILDEPSFRLGLQLGVTPKKDAIALYLGTTVGFADGLSFGGGVTWRQIRVLSDDLAAGSTVSGSEDIHTRTVFSRPALYLHTTLALGSNK